MPVYEYECKDCSMKFELRRSFEDETEPECPKCKGKGQRLFSPVAIIFNGRGFYMTDNRKNGSESEKTEEVSSSSEKAA